jgi:hypothetical protein
MGEIMLNTQNHGIGIMLYVISHKFSVAIILARTINEMMMMSTLY